MRQKRWLVIGGAMTVLATGAALGLGDSSAADEPVRVYLVHGAQDPLRGHSSTSSQHGIWVYATDQGNMWPTRVVGYLDDMDEHWVVLRKASGEDRKAEIHIPRERVQLIEHISEEYLRALLTAR